MKVVDPLVLLIGSICYLQPHLVPFDGVNAAWTGHEGDYLKRPDLIDLEVLQNGEPDAEKRPYPWGNSFHYPFFTHQKSILSDQWVPMTYKEAHKYYNAYEACVVMESNWEHCNGHNFKHNEIGKCQINDRGDIFPQDTVCPNLKGNFIRHESTKPWPENKYVVDVIAKMKEYGSNLLVFVGDSVTGNQYADTYCALSRVGVKSSHAGLEYLILNDPNEASSTSINPEVESTTKQFFVMRYFRYDGLHHSFEEFMAKAEKLHALHAHAPIVYLVNIGLHFNSAEEDYPGRLTQLLQYFIELSKKYQDIIIFRETTAQHFQTKSKNFRGEVFGYDNDYSFSLNEDEIVDNQVYFSPLMNPKNRRYYNDSTREKAHVNRADIHFCAPIRTKEELHENNWRNRVMYEVLKQIDPNEEHIHVAKFHEVTAGRHDLHSLGDDCTHYCASPILYYPLWQNIYDIVEKEYSKRQAPLVRKVTKGH